MACVTLKRPLDFDPLETLHSPDRPPTKRRRCTPIKNVDRWVIFKPFHVKFFFVFKDGRPCCDKNTEIFFKLCVFCLWPFFYLKKINYFIEDLTLWLNGIALSFLAFRYIAYILSTTFTCSDSVLIFLFIVRLLHSKLILSPPKILSKSYFFKDKEIVRITERFK